MTTATDLCLHYLPTAACAVCSAPAKGDADSTRDGLLTRTVLVTLTVKGAPVTVRLTPYVATKGRAEGNAHAAFVASACTTNAQVETSAAKGYALGAVALDPRTMGVRVENAKGAKRAAKDVVTLDAKTTAKGRAYRSGQVEVTHDGATFVVSAYASLNKRGEWTVKVNAREGSLAKRETAQVTVPEVTGLEGLPTV